MAAFRIGRSVAGALTWPLAAATSLSILDGAQGVKFALRTRPAGVPAMMYKARQHGQSLRLCQHRVLALEQNG